MGFLTMLGLVTAEQHNRIVAKHDALIDRAAKEMKGEDFDGVTDHAGRVALIMARLRAARTRFDRAVKDLATQSDEIAVLKSALDAGNEANMALVKDNNALRQDAEKFRAKAARDAESKRAKRAAAKAG